jgi:hypothetical protein
VKRRQCTSAENHFRREQGKLGKHFFLESALDNEPLRSGAKKGNNTCIGMEIGEIMFVKTVRVQGVKSSLSVFQ